MWRQGFENGTLSARQCAATTFDVGSVFVPTWRLLAQRSRVGRTRLRLLGYDKSYRRVGEVAIIVEAAGQFEQLGFRSVQQRPGVFELKHFGRVVLHCP